MDEAANEQQCGSSPSFSPPSEVREPAREDSDLAERKPMRSLHALLRRQATYLIDRTLHAELEVLLAQHASITDAHGRPAYVRNGYQPPRDLLTNLGPVRIRIPKVRSRIERPVIFRSTVARPYLRRSRSTISAAPARFLHGLGMGDLHAAIGALMGAEAAALPGPVMRRLAQQWEDEHSRWLTQSLAPLKRISLWLDSLDADDVQPQGAGSVMVAVAIDESAREQILSIARDSSETEQSWAQLLRGLRCRGMPAPMRVHANGKAPRAIAAATAAVYPETRTITERIEEETSQGVASRRHTPDMTERG